MKILIYGINYSPELTGIGKYSSEISEWLANQGHEVKVITSQPYYPDWKIFKDYKNNYTTSTINNVEVIRCPLYVPKKPNFIKRLLHLLSFSITSFIPVIKSSGWKPDVVIQVVPTLFCSLQTLILSKKSRSKSMIHIQDFELDAMFGLSMLGNNIIKRIAYFFEKKIFKSFDLVSTISSGMLKKLIIKGIDINKTILLPNWTEIDHFKNAKKNEDFLKKAGIDNSKKIVMYSGNIGKKQGLEIVIHTAKEMQIYKDIFFIIIGEGAAKNELLDLKIKLNLNNIIFLPLQPYDLLPSILASADCHLIIQKNGAADAVLPSKLTNILAVGGNSIITARKDTTLGELCMDNIGIATLIEPESTEQLKDGIIKTINMKQPNKIALNYAKEFLDKELILKKFIKTIS